MEYELEIFSVAINRNNPVADRNDCVVNEDLMVFGDHTVIVTEITNIEHPENKMFQLVISDTESSLNEAKSVIENNTQSEPNTTVVAESLLSQIENIIYAAQARKLEQVPQN